MTPNVIEGNWVVLDPERTKCRDFLIKHNIDIPGIKEGFLVDCLVGNYDVIGNNPNKPGYDNIVLVVKVRDRGTQTEGYDILNEQNLKAGKIYALRIDVGASFIWSGSGSLKSGCTFNSKVGKHPRTYGKRPIEFYSLRDDEFDPFTDNKRANTIFSNIKITDLSEFKGAFEKAFASDKISLLLSGVNGDKAEIITIIKARKDKILTLLENNIKDLDKSLLSIASDPKTQGIHNIWKNTFHTCCYKRLTLLLIIMNNNTSDSIKNKIQVDALNEITKLNKGFLSGRFKSCYADSKKQFTIYQTLVNYLYPDNLKRSTYPKILLYLCFQQLVVGKILYDLFQNVISLKDYLISIAGSDVIDDDDKLKSGYELFFKNFDPGIPAKVLTSNTEIFFPLYSGIKKARKETPSGLSNASAKYSPVPSLFLFSGISSYRMDAFLLFLHENQGKIGINGKPGIPFNLPYFLSTTINRDMACNWASKFTNISIVNSNWINKKHIIAIEVPNYSQDTFPFAYFGEKSGLDGCGECEVFTNIYNNYEYMNAIPCYNNTNKIMVHHLKYLGPGNSTSIFNLTNFTETFTNFAGDNSIFEDAIDGFTKKTGGSKRIKYRKTNRKTNRKIKKTKTHRKKKTKKKKKNKYKNKYKYKKKRTKRKY